MVASELNGRRNRRKGSEVHRFTASRGSKAFEIVNACLLMIITMLFLYPLIFVLSASLSDPRQIYDSHLILWPKGFTLDSYKTVFEKSEVLIGYVNSLIYTVLGTLFGLSITVFGAYPLSRPDFKGRNALTVFLVFTMYFSGGLIPLYLVVESLGMVNTRLSMVIPGVVSVYNMIIVRTYFQSRIPREFYESAVAEGCGNFRLLLQIYIPLSTPILVVMVLFYAVAQWNTYFNGLIFLTDRSLFSLQLILRELLVRNEMDQMMHAMTDYNLAERIMQREGLQYAIIVVSSLPLMILYPLIGKQIKDGIMVGALKG